MYSRKKNLLVSMKIFKINCTYKIYNINACTSIRTVRRIYNQPATVYLTHALIFFCKVTPPWWSIFCVCYPLGLVCTVNVPTVFSCNLYASARFIRVKPALALQFTYNSPALSTCGIVYNTNYSSGPLADKKKKKNKYILVIKRYPFVSSWLASCT